MYLLFQHSRSIKKIMLTGLILLVSSSTVMAQSCMEILQAKAHPEKLCYEIGQMLIVGFGGLSQQADHPFNDPHGTVFSENSNIAHDIKRYHVGGVILYSMEWRNQQSKVFIRDRNIQSPQQVVTLTAALKHYSDLYSPQPAMPLLVSIDQEGGQINRLSTTYGYKNQGLLPEALGLKEQLAGNNILKKQLALSETTQFATKIATALDSSGINVDYAPVADINIDPTNPIIGGLGRSFSNFPKIVVDQDQQMIRVLQQKNIISTLKHFPGHGSSVADSHVGMVDVTDTYQPEKELAPYRYFIKAGFTDMIMTAHVINGQLDRTQCRSGSIDDHQTWCPGTLSYKTNTVLLRHKLGFKGVLVSDDMTMGAIADYYPLKDALRLAINSGVDMLIFANFYQDYTPQVVTNIAELVASNDIPVVRINQAYKRIQSLKRRLVNHRLAS